MTPLLRVWVETSTRTKAGRSAWMTRYARVWIETANSRKRTSQAKRHPYYAEVD